VTDPYSVPRDSHRVPLATRVQLSFERFTGFISEYSSNISPGGMFIRTRDPKPPGTVVTFELRLGDGYELISGRGQVIWNRQADEAVNRPAGMGIRFLDLAPGSRELIYRMVDQHIQDGGTPFDLAPPVPEAQPPQPGAAPSPAPASPPAPSPAMPPKPAPAPVQPATAAPAASQPIAPADTATPGSRPVAPVAPPSSTAAPALPAPPAPTPPAPGPTAVPWPEPVRAAAPAPPPAAAAIPENAPAAPAARVPAVRWRAVRWAGLAALVGLAVLAFLSQDRLLNWALRRDATSGPPPIPVRGNLPPARRAAASPASGPSEAPPAGAAAAPEVRPAAVAAGPAAPAPAATATLPPPASPPPAPVPADRLERITWQQGATGTEVVLEGNGSFSRQSYVHLRIDGEPPRELVRLAGIRWPFAERLTVGTRQVRQVRTGLHSSPGRSELHVVLDLTGAGVEITSIDLDDRRLHIRLQGE
jgi:molecular chaperone DnaK